MVTNKEKVLIVDGNDQLTLSALSDIGGRKEQQDSLGYSFNEKGCIVSLCDGMGGYEGGQIASLISAEAMVESFEQAKQQPIQELLQYAVQEANRRIWVLKDQDPSIYQSGSTTVTVVVTDNQLYWISVGDSRGYLIRDNEIVQFTKDQNYRVVLEEKVRAGVMTEAQKEQESVRGDALISYLGIKELGLIDYNKIPLQLFPGDRVLMVSDGLYRWISDEMILQIIQEAGSSQKALETMNGIVAKKAEQANRKRDNLTAVLIDM